MKRRFDIREYKRELRVYYKTVRGELTPEEKSEKDEMIFKHVLAMPDYVNCKTLLCYVSMPREADTFALIESAIAYGKRVAVPTTRGTGMMDFHEITSLSGLVPGKYGVLEPEPDPDKRLIDFQASLCVLPGLAFDIYGYRLGYGGGYYDRFLAGVFDGKTVGICYRRCVMPDKMRHGRMDIPCDYIVTEDGCEKTLVGGTQY